MDSALSRMPSAITAVSAISWLGSAMKRVIDASISDEPSSARTSPIFARATSAPETMSLLRSDARTSRNTGTILVRIVSSDGRSVSRAFVPPPKKSSEFVTRTPP